MPNANAVKFVMGTAAEYLSATKDSSTLYFITDEQRIYKGAIPYSGGIFTTVASLPATGNVNTIYGVSNGAVAYWDGQQYRYLVNPLVTNISTNETSGNTVTARAVAEYVASKLTTMDTNIDSRLDAIENDISDLETDKADKATTLAGYGITDAYTKTETDAAISAAVVNADHLKREIVSTLPTVADADPHTIYMVPTSASGASAGNDSSYDEYMVVNGSWEKVGDSHVNLTDYYTKTQVDNAVSGAVSTAADDATTKANAAKTYADGLISSEVARANAAYATAAQGALADTALQQADITTGSTNGTIAVDGTDVAVQGLGSAAYTASTAYDAAGAAAAALTSANNYTDQQLAAGVLVWQTIS